MVKLPLLQPNDLIGVCAPSSYVEESDIEKSKALLEGKGYRVEIHPQTYERHHQSAGTHEQKIEALHALYADTNIKAIWAAGGGNRALHLLDRLDFNLIKNNPKPLIGFSDITALLNAIYARTGVPGLHGPVFKALHGYDDAQINHTLNILSSGTPDISLEKAQIIKEGTATGPLIGGCLSLFQYLAETRDCPPLDGALLFLEDTGDHISRIDRMLTHLQRLGVFEKINGLILGEFHDLQDGARPFGLTLKDVVSEYTQNTNIPVVMNAPFGHKSTLFSLPIGRSGVLDTQQKKLILNESLTSD